MTVEELLQGYSHDYSWDEMMDKAMLRSHYQPLFQKLADLDFSTISQLHQQASEMFMSQGITFTVYSDDAGIERIFPFDIIPRIITAACGSGHQATS
jgi:uncharacterized circularly permuted ATP-grasp superfamily protein